MLKILVKLKTWLAKALEIAVIVIMGALVLDVLWQVVTRFASTIPTVVPLPSFAAAFLESVKPSSWSEELATMLLIWVSLLGASVAFIEKSHLGVDYFVNKLPAKPKAVIEIVVYVLIGCFAVGALMYGGYRLVSLTLLTDQRSAALGIKMGHVYLALPISGFFILIFSIETVIEKTSLMLKKQELDGNHTVGQSGKPSA